MASLLGVFRASVPPVLKRRGKELLDVIRACVKSGLTLMSGGDMTMEVNEEVEMIPEAAENVIHVDGPEGVTLQDDDTLRLWGREGTLHHYYSRSCSPFVSLDHAPSAPSSSLFGLVPQQQCPTPSNILTTSTSTLFGAVPTNRGALSLVNTFN